jgi:glyoxylase-like metal-dependent hydrolase (beta-lactamase superfamily II)
MLEPDNGIRQVTTMTLIYDGALWSIQGFVSGFENNAYLVTCKRTNGSIVVDTPDTPSELLKAMAGTNVRAVLITHNHWDHLQGLDDVIAAADVHVGIGQADAHAIKSQAEPDIDVSHDALVNCGDITLRAIATPGHTPGSTCYMLPSETPGATPHVFTGDTLFPGGPGKSGSPEAFKQMVASVESHLLTLPRNAIILPGHGRSTTVADSKAEFGVFLANPRRDDLHGDVLWAGDNG